MANIYIYKHTHTHSRRKTVQVHQRGRQTPPLKPPKEQTPRTNPQEQPHHPKPVKTKLKQDKTELAKPKTQLAEQKHGSSKTTPTTSQKGGGGNPHPTPQKYLQTSLVKFLEKYMTIERLIYIDKNF